jgi:hypothetical protein
MNRNEMYTNIRLVTQTDTTDLPNTTCDLFLEQAWQHAAYWKAQWPFYRKTWTYTFAGDGTDFAFTSKELVAGGTTTATVAHPAAPNSIEAIYDTLRDNKLAFVDNAEFNRLLRANDTTTGDPRVYTIEQNEYADSGTTNLAWQPGFTVKMWPIPSASTNYTLRIEGFREPISFVTPPQGYVSGTVPGGYYSSTATSAVPDMPTPFHEAILNYAIGLAFAYLDEGDRSVYYSALADNKLIQLEAHWFRAPATDGPVVLNGGQKRGAYNTLPGRLRYDYE